MAENNEIPIMTPQQWAEAYETLPGSPVVKPTPEYPTYTEYIEAMRQQAEATGATLKPITSGTPMFNTVPTYNAALNPGTMDNYNVGAGVALAQMNGDQYYYGYGAVDDPRAGNNRTTYMPGTMTQVSANSLTSPDSASAGTSNTQAEQSPASAPTDNPDAATWIANRKKQFIDQNSGYWTTTEASEQGLADAERVAINEYNEQYGTTVDPVKGTITKTEVDASGNVVRTTTTQYDPDMNNAQTTTIRESTENGGTRVTTKNHNTGTTTIVESSGSTRTTTEIRSDGSRTETRVNGTSQGSVTTTNEYDRNGNVTKTTTTTAGNNGNTTKVVDRVSGTVVETRTDTNGQTTSVTRQYDPDMDNLESEVTVSQSGDSLKVGYSSDREGKTNSEVEIDFEKFIMAYDKVQSLVDAASHISEYKNISGVNALPVKGGGSINTSALTSMACMNGACGRGGNIQGISTTMLNVIKAIVAFDDDSAALWDKYNQEKNGETPEDFGGDLSEDAGSTEPAGSNPDDSGTETATELATEAPTSPYRGPNDGPDVPDPEDVTEATTEMTEEEQMKLLAEQLGVDLDELANGAKYITNGEDFDGLNIYYEEGSTTETSLANRMLNILNTFGRAADDQSLYDADGNKIERLDPNATELTFKYKKDGKEHTITLKLNNELPLEDKKYPGIQVIVKE